MSKGSAKTKDNAEQMTMFGLKKKRLTTFKSKE